MGERSDIKNIVFDLGAVLLDIDFDLTIEAFRKLGVENNEQFKKQAGKIMLFEKYEKGMLSTAQFLDGMRKLMPGNAADDSIIKAWNALVVSFPKENLDLLKALKPHYHLYLLSNTNELHLTRFHELIFEQHGLNGLDNFFKRLYYSNAEGLRKPEAAFYQLLLEQEGLDPSETAFIDDVQSNVEGAEDVGITGILLEKGIKVSELFDKEYKFLGYS